MRYYALILFLCNFYSCQLIEKTDSKTHEKIYFEKVNKWIDGTPINNRNIDDVIYIKEKNEFYKRIFNGKINVKWFGAVGDGISDDTESITKALDFIRLNLDTYFSKSLDQKIDIELFFPKGIYMVSSTLTVPMYATLVGENTGNTILQIRNPNTPVIIIKKPVKGNINRQANTNTLIKGLTIAGKFFNTNPYEWKTDRLDAGAGIILDNVININLEDLKISGFEDSGILINQSSYININQVQLYNNKIGLIIKNNSTTVNVTKSNIRANSLGVFIGDSFSNSFLNTTFESNTASYLNLLPKKEDKSMLKSGVGIYMSNSYNNIFQSCYIEDNLVSVLLYGAYNNIFKYNLICPTNNFSYKNENIDYAQIKFKGSNNNGNKFIYNHIVSLDEKLYPAYIVKIDSYNYGIDNVIYTLNSSDFSTYIKTNNDWKNIFKSNPELSPKIINDGSMEVYKNLQRYMLSKDFIQDKK